jgi:glycosyltransferase involved in cell wall biosynthesis
VLAPQRPGDGFGGAERHLCDLEHVLRAIGADVEFFSLADAPHPSAPERWIARAVPLLTSPLAARRLWRSGRLPESDVLLTVEITGCGVRHPRHLHLFFGSYCGFRRSALAPVGVPRALGRAMVTALARALENWTQGRDGAVANSLGLRAALASAGVSVRDEVIVPPTDTERFRPRDRDAARRALRLPLDRRLLLFAGRWEYAKGADRVEHLMPLLPANWSLVLACPSGATWPLPKRGIRLIDVPHERMPDVYSAADALIQPSRFEGYSLVVSEAQACGCPVVTGRVGHGEHMLQGSVAIRSGVVASPDSPAAWRDALLAVAGDAPLRAVASAAARAYAEEVVAPSAVARHWFDLLARLYPELRWQPPR